LPWDSDVIAAEMARGMEKKGRKGRKRKGWMDGRMDGWTEKRGAAKNEGG